MTDAGMDLIVAIFVRWLLSVQIHKGDAGKENNLQVTDLPRTRPVGRDLRRTLRQLDDRSPSRRSGDPNRFAGLVMVGPSPRYIDDAAHVGGFSDEDIVELLESLESNYPAGRVPWRR